MRRPIWRVLSGIGFGATGLYFAALGVHLWLPTVPRIPLWVCGLIALGLVMTVGGIFTAVREDVGSRS